MDDTGMMIKAIGLYSHQPESFMLQGHTNMHHTGFWLHNKEGYVYGSAFCLIIPEGSLPEKRPCLQKPLWNCSTGTMYQVHYYDVLQERYLHMYIPQRMWYQGILGSKFMSLTRVWGVLWGKQIAVLKTVSPARYFSQLLDSKIPWGLCRSGYIIFWLWHQIVKFKIRQFKKYSVLAETTKFSVHQIYPLYSRTEIIITYIFT